MGIGGVTVPYYHFTYYVVLCSIFCDNRLYGRIVKAAVKLNCRKRWRRQIRLSVAFVRLGATNVSLWSFLMSLVHTFVYEFHGAMVYYVSSHISVLHTAVCKSMICYNDCKLYIVYLNMDHVQLATSSEWCVNKSEPKLGGKHDGNILITLW